jgi:DNA-binding NarL/FixJ family response regulator
MATMAATFARLERRRISERRREAAEAKRRELRIRRLRILELARDGLSQRAIARELRTHKETVARVLRGGL